MDQKVLDRVQQLEDRIAELEQDFRSINRELHVLRDAYYANIPIPGADLNISTLIKHKIQQPS
jgi:hypothetical protein